MNQSNFSFVYLKIIVLRRNLLQVDQYQIECLSFNKAKRQRERKRKRRRRRKKSSFSSSVEQKEKKEQAISSRSFTLRVSVEHFSLWSQYNNDDQNNILFIIYLFFIIRSNFKNKYWWRCNIFLFFWKWIWIWSSKF